MGRNGRAVDDEERWLAVEAASTQILLRDPVLGGQRPGFFQPPLVRLNS